MLALARTRLRFDPIRLALLTALGVGAGACGPAKSGDAGDEGGDGDSADTADDDDDGGGPDLGDTPSLCLNPTPILDGGADTGFRRCDDGTVHRAFAASCVQKNDEPACQGTEPQQECTEDSDCADGPNGRCVSRAFEGGVGDYCGCAYSCEDDGDCDPGSVCVCSGVVPTPRGGPTCAPAQCLDNAACDSGECGVSSFESGCGPSVGLACRDEVDVCRLDADCGTSGAQCSLGGQPGGWGCYPADCAIGRPLMVDGAPRVASAGAREDWLTDIGGKIAISANAERRAALARHWRGVAALEHASVASFARFTLGLMAHGAPPTLLADAQRAAADEVEHARLAFALASAYGGAPLGPQRLDVKQLPLGTELEPFVRGLVEEACVGETLGVAEALAHADATDDPVVAALLRTIAADELRHAQLAWRTLQWIVAREPRARAVALAAYENAVDRVLVRARTNSPGSHPDLDAETLGELHVTALDQLVAPSLRAALG